ncbi:NAD(P)-dependent dehydrogenase, short-chain alcohol dehydrogenase family [Kushneria avicenniae]|uniref:NAD(P)-dependent dehydrogenase, short-chain alcohol dehydrogenase family n=1 Tax=Kushneria avicenniae TaxID=402385 RepID=A0A1I1GH89_9GAMM|nr:SDR family NAD(P)-dependent oxidoreductase [Kushneria avicenniae]SFC10796.1 NAD(P)-dependent dehydrogenase, short-chain alcohol dehydrogenase family [Kushneria avicenniae]
MLDHLPEQYTAVIIGGGGIGSALLARLLQDPRAGRIVAVTRHRERLAQDERLDIDRLDIVEADVTSDEGLQTLSEYLQKAPVHLLFNTIGVLHDGQSDQSVAMAPEKRLERLSFEALQHAFHINAATTAMLVSTLADRLTRHPAIIAALSARVGSIGDNELGGWYAYRASKAALNMLMKTASIEFRRRNPQAILLCLHPGTTDTELSRPFQARVPDGKLFTTEFVADRLLEVINQRTPEDSGAFYDWNNTPIEW